MNKEQIIEEMARDICECYNNDGTCYQDDMPCDLKCEHMTEAQFLYDKGYRKVVMCNDCEYRVKTNDGEYNPNDIVCDYFSTDGMEACDYCSYGKKDGE